MKKYLLLTLLLTLLFSSSLFASHFDGIAMHPSGEYLVAGGENRVLYVVHTNTLKVSQRIWTRARIKHLFFNKKGDRLLVVTDETALVWYDTKTWKPVHKISKRVSHQIAVAPLANVAIYKVQSFKKSFNLISLDDGKILHTVELQNRISISAIGLNSKGTKLVVLSASIKDESETKKRIPKGLNGKERALFVQQNDGRKSQLFVYDIKSSKEERNQTLWYKPFGSSGELFIADNGDVYIASYANGHLKIDKDGKTELFVTPNNYCYGKGFDTSGKVLLTGGMQKGSITQLESKQSRLFELEKLPGFPEYFSELIMANNGSVYGVTSAYRVVEIDKAGKVRTTPIY